MNYNTDENQECNCEYWNQAQLRAHAREKKIPIVRFPALHGGISNEKGLELDSKRFNELPAYLELAEEAPILLTMNLDVEHGLKWQSRYLC